MKKEHFLVERTSISELRDACSIKQKWQQVNEGEMRSLISLQLPCSNSYGGSQEAHVDKILNKQFFHWK